MFLYTVVAINKYGLLVQRVNVRAEDIFIRRGNGHLLGYQINPFVKMLLLVIG